MAKDKTDPERLIDFKAKLKTAKKTDEAGLREFAAMWGVSKPRFVNKRAEIADFPDPVRKQGNTDVYLLIPCLKAMIAHLERHKTAQVEKAVRQKKLTPRAAAENVESLPVADLVRLNTLAADVEQREREQGLYIPAADVERVAGFVFSSLSNLLSNLAKRIDPHGRLPAATRKLIDDEGHKQLLSLHAEIKRLVKPDADPRRSRVAARKTGGARARRTRS